MRRTPIMKRLVGAPISWGVCEIPEWGALIPPEVVLAEMAELGLRSTELGPVGYFPEDPIEVKEMLGRYDMGLAGGFVPLVFHEAALADATRDHLERAAVLLASAGAPVFVSAAVWPTGVSAGRLDESQWRQMAAMVEEVEDRVLSHGLAHAFHPHYGTVVENDRQLAELLARADVGLCLDTGHLAMGGIDVVRLVRDAGARIRHVHLKDVDLALADQVSREGLLFRDGVRKGLFRPLGRGDVPVGKVISMLEAAGYAGLYVLEQDTSWPEGELDTDTPRRDVKMSIDFVLDLGLESPERFVPGVS